MRLNDCHFTCVRAVIALSYMTSLKFSFSQFALCFLKVVRYVFRVRVHNNLGPFVVVCNGRTTNKVTITASCIMCILLLGVHNWVYVTSIVLSYNAKSSAAFLACVA